MTSSSETVRLPSDDETIGPVTILDAQGRVLRVVSAEDFRRSRLTATAEPVDDLPHLASLRAKRAERRATAESRLRSAAARALPRAIAS
jgi:PHD/YefM family antitoxin component YafN of YafNO toxin-antitoxin module